MKRITFYLVCSLFLLGSCHNHSHTAHTSETTDEHAHVHTHDDHDHEHEADAHSHAHDADDILIEPEKAAAAGIRSEEIQPKEFHSVIKVGGELLAAPTDETIVVATISGVVRFMQPLAAGSSVREGSTLIALSTSNMDEGDHIAKDLAAYEMAKREYERLLPLFERRIITEREFNQVKLDYENARISYDAIAGDASVGGQRVPAPISGYVSEVIAREGDYVTIGSPVLRLSQHRTFWLRADVPLRYYGELNRVWSANYRPAYTDSVYRLSDGGGKLLTYGRTTNGERTSFVPVTFEIREDDEKLLAGTYADVYLLTKSRPNTLTVPRSALMEELGTYYVYVQESDHSYRKQEVEIGADDGREVELLTGIHAGDRVVVEGAYEIKLASVSNIIPPHTHEH
ncbi:MAG: efflux RND transporter periplasmic adaptor subunit [Prevotellaceae bacterium]|jgi:RND family efflux transporter MFP subunit|nr:efflux RND transporter periplasmic adaptor subunit [Prevotellaceae bacterium]